jgi:hypothetical protein
MTCMAQCPPCGVHVNGALLLFCLHTAGLFLEGFLSPKLYRTYMHAALVKSVICTHFSPRLLGHSSVCPCLPSLLIYLCTHSEPVCALEP